MSVRDAASSEGHWEEKGQMVVGVNACVWIPYRREGLYLTHLRFEDESIHKGGIRFEDESIHKGGVM